MGKLPAVPGPHLQAKCPWLGKNRHKIENQMCRMVYPRWAALHHSPSTHLPLGQSSSKQAVGASWEVLCGLCF